VTQAQALDEPADDLAAVDAGIDGFADIHEQIGRGRR